MLQALFEKPSSFLRPLKKKGFKEERSDLLPMAKARGIPPLGRTPNALPAPQAPAYLPMAKARGITQDLVGQRFAGGVGALAAVAGLLGWPAVIVIALGMLYQRYGALPAVHHALTGMSAVGAGLLLTSGVRMATVLPRQWRPWLFTGLAFVGVGVLRWSLLGVMGALAPIAIATAWKETP
jgi:Chromate transporter